MFLNLILVVAAESQSFAGEADDELPVQSWSIARPAVSSPPAFVRLTSVGSFCESI